VNRSELVFSSVHSDGKLNLLPVARALPDNTFQNLDFDYLGETLVELVYDQEEVQPYRILIDGELAEAYGDRGQAEFAFKAVQQEMLEAAQAAKEAREDYERR
jgi:hypothetical protein